MRSDVLLKITPMKLIHTSLLLLIINTVAMSEEAPQKLPDFTKVFPNEKMVSQSNIQNIQSYAYATNMNLADLKKVFSEYLGKQWIEVDIDKETKKAVTNTALYRNPAFPKVQIGISLMCMEVEGKKSLVGITVIPAKSNKPIKVSEPQR